MANTFCCSKTNMFCVTNEERYNKLFSRLTCSNDEIEDFTNTKNGEMRHGFGAYGPIDYVNFNDEYDFDEFVSELQKILPEGEVFIYLESGHEKLRYIYGMALIATKDDVKHVEITNQAELIARELLNNPDFVTGL